MRYSSRMTNPHLLLALTAFFWAGHWIVARAAIGEMTPVSMSFWRWMTAVAVLAIISRLEPGRIAGLQFNPGDLFLLANALLWSLYTVCLRWKPPQLSQTSFLLAAAVFGLLPMLPLYALDLAAGGRFEPGWGAVLGVLYLGVFPSVLCYQMWGKGVMALGAARSGIYLHLVPPFGAGMAMLFLGERLQVYHVAGFALILAGIFLTSRRSA